MFDGKQSNLVRRIYLYGVSAISIGILIIGMIGIINLVLKEYVFDVKSWDEIQGSYWECDNLMAGYSAFEMVKSVEVPAVPLTPEEYDACIAKQKAIYEEQHVNNIKGEFIIFLSMILVALPIYIFHWGLIRKEEKK